VVLDGMPDVALEIPEGITQARIDSKTGLLARQENRNAIMESFRQGSLPAMEDASELDISGSETEEDPYDSY